MNICPKSAIKMQADEYGFIYPVIQQDLCVQCGACMTVCGYQNKPKTEEPKRFMQLPLKIVFCYGSPHLVVLLQ